MTVTLALLVAAGRPARADDEAVDPRDRRIAELEKTVGELVGRVRELEGGRDFPGLEEELEELKADFAAFEGASIPNYRNWTNRLRLGGYGELHYNFAEGSASDQADIHRFVIYLGYEFSDVLRLSSETEIEHAFVGGDSGGEVAIEQLFVDRAFSDEITARVGRLLIPVGIVNQRHEPTTFNGVERPTFDRVIVPTTWFSDGFGTYGTITPSLAYQLYLVAGMDGTGFDALNGIRGGRMKERPGLHDPAVTARLDFFPFAEGGSSTGQVLRFGASTWIGGLDNGNRGRNPGLDADLQVWSVDAEYSASIFDFRGAVAAEFIDGAREIGNGTASVILGWFLEGAVHVLPESMRTGPLRRSDLVLFARYEDIDTQYRMPRGVEDDPRGDRTLWTFGIGFFPLANLVLKLDYVIQDDESGDGLPDLFNIGVGWQF